MGDSILIGTTPTHLIPMLEVADQLPGQILFFHPEAQRIPQRYRERLAFLGGCERTNRSRSSKYLAAGRSLRRVLAKGANATVCVPHPFNPLSNFACFAPGANDVRIYQDGMLNYYDATNPFGQAFALARRRLLALGALLPYRAYAGHLSGIEARSISTGYFTHPEHVVLKECFSRIAPIKFAASLASIDQAEEGNAVTLFLDQPIERFVPAEDVVPLRRLAREVADSMGRPVLYKPHYVQRYPFGIEPGWQLASDEEMALPAEEIPMIRSVGAVVSFCSSALVNIRLLQPGVRCVAVGGTLVPIRIDGEQKTVADLLSKFGVETVEAT